MVVPLAIIIIGFIIFLLAAIPLNLAVKLVGGHTHLLKTALVSLVAGILIAGIELLTKSFIGSIVGFIVLLFVYKAAFDIGFFRAILVWLLHGVLTVVLTIAAVLLLGGLGILAVSL